MNRPISGIIGPKRQARKTWQRGRKAIAQTESVTHERLAEVGARFALPREEVGWSCAIATPLVGHYSAQCWAEDMGTFRLTTEMR